MVQLTNVNRAMMKTFGLYNKKKYNHRVPIKYQRFQVGIDPEEIVAHYSRDDIDKLDPRAGIRTYKDATQTMGRKNYLLPDLGEQDLEINHSFQRELDRQRAIVARVDKIRVLVDSEPGKGSELMMNKNISTPYHCAQHIHDLLTTRSVVAEIVPAESELTTANKDGDDEDEDPFSDEEEEKKKPVKFEPPKSIYWDMHRPLESSCTLKFRHFAENDVAEVNKIYWRSCSFILGMAVRLAFKNDVKVLLHSWPRPNIKSGSFVYDVALNLSNTWTPAEQELRAFTKIMWKIKSQSLPFDRLQVDREMAKNLFRYNPFKLAQIDSILADESSQGKVTVYRCGGLLDMSVGPMISNTNQVGRITLSSVHPFETSTEEFKGVFYRFQGVSLPQQLPVSPFVYQNIIIDNAKKLNKASL